MESSRVSVLQVSVKVSTGPGGNYMVPSCTKGAAKGLTLQGPRSPRWPLDHVVEIVRYLLDPFGWFHLLISKEYIRTTPPFFPPVAFEVRRLRSGRGHCRCCRQARRELRSISKAWRFGSKCVGQPVALCTPRLDGYSMGKRANTHTHSAYVFFCF